MAFCSNCGTQIEDGAHFCPGCGAPTGAAQPSYGQQAQHESHQDDFSAKIADLNNTEDSTSEFDPADITSNKAMAVLAYLSWLVLIPLFAAKESQFARFHVNQGLVLAVTEIIWWVAEGIVSSIFYSIAWGLGSLVSTVMGVANILFLVLTVIGVVNAVNGKAKELPVIGKFRILK